MASTKSEGLTDQMKFDQVEETAEYLLSQTKYRPEVAIICGTGLGGIGEIITDGQLLPYESIPNFGASKVKGHAGRLLFGKLHDKSVVCMLGRIHAYEGHSMWQVSFPVRVFQRIGVKVLLVTNASGSVNPSYKAGDIMVIKDHINLPGLAGFNPLVGLNDSRFGTRFPALNDAYDFALRKQMRRTATELKLPRVHEGVYVCQIGPGFETVAECRMILAMGGDAVGMSTAPEVIVARHGPTPMRVVGLSLVTNVVVSRYPDDPKTSEDEADSHPDHDTILKTAATRADDLRLLVSTFVKELDTNPVASH